MIGEIFGGIALIAGTCVTFAKENRTKMILGGIAVCCGVAIIVNAALA